MSILPTDILNVTTLTDSSEDLPIFKEYAWDFDNDEFIIQDGELVIVEKNEALKVWIYKALKTPKFRYVAYDYYYGNEFESLVGKEYDSDLVSIELKALIEKCLLVNKYIQSIDSVDLEFNDGKVTGTIYLTTIYDSMEQEVDVDV